MFLNLDNISRYGRQGDIWANIENHEYFRDNSLTFGQFSEIFNLFLDCVSCMYIYTFSILFDLYILRPVWYRRVFTSDKFVLN
jgi:hypothetical protein